MLDQVDLCVPVLGSWSVNVMATRGKKWAFEVAFELQAVEFAIEML